MFLNAEPHNTGTNLPLSVPSRMQRLSVASSGSLAAEIGFEHVVVELYRSLDESVAVGFGLGFEIARHRLVLELRAQRIVLPDHRPIGDQIDIADIVSLRAPTGKFRIQWLSAPSRSFIISTQRR